MTTRRMCTTAGRSILVRLAMGRNAEVGTETAIYLERSGRGGSNARAARPPQPRRLGPPILHRILDASCSLFVTAMYPILRVVILPITHTSFTLYI
jgi:hypothetical protein